MKAGERGEQVVARIGFAERWLERARGQVSAGHLTRGLLTLVLADAEVQHALEAAGARPQRRRRTKPLIARAAVAVSAIALLFAVWPASEPHTEAAVDAGPHIVSLSPRVGTLLSLFAPAPPPSVEDVAVRVPTPTTLIEEKTQVPRLLPRAPAAHVKSTFKKSAVQAPAQMSAARPIPAMAPAPTTQVVQPAVPQLSAGDLIDLVLAAERALRDSTPPP